MKLLRLIMLVLLALAGPTAHATITYVGRVIVPATDNDTNDTQSVALDPSGLSPASGDMFIVSCAVRGSASTITNTEAGGQTWNAATALQGAGVSNSARIFWAVYNGTLSATPTFDLVGSGIATSCVMTVFRPTSGFAFNTTPDAAQAASGPTTYSTNPTDYTTADVSAGAASRVVLAFWWYNDNLTLALQSPGSWVNPSSETQWRNSSGTGFVISQAYLIQSSSAASGTITNRLTGTTGGSIRYATIAFSESAVAGAPSYTSGPTKTSTQTDGYTYSFTPNLNGAASVDAHLSCYKKDSATPSVANVLAGAGTGFVAHFSELGVTGADTITATGLTFPVHDCYHALTSSGGNIAAVSSHVDECLEAAEGEQIGNCPDGYTSIAEGSVIDRLNDEIATAVAVGDIPICPLKTTPGGPVGFNLTVALNGNFSHDGDSSRQYANCTFYDLSAGDFNADDLDLWFNNQPPTGPPPGSVTFFIPEDTPMTPVDLSDYCSDADDDAITVTGQNIPTGLEIVANTLQGTATTRGIYTDPIFTCTDVPGDSVEW